MPSKQDSDDHLHDVEQPINLVRGHGHVTGSPARIRRRHTTSAVEAMPPVSSPQSFAQDSRQATSSGGEPGAYTQRAPVSATRSTPSPTQRRTLRQVARERAGRQSLDVQMVPLVNDDQPGGAQ